MGSRFVIPSPSEDAKGAPDKSSGKRRQKVHIEYDLVGYIPVDELLKAEQA